MGKALERVRSKTECLGGKSLRHSSEITEEAVGGPEIFTDMVEIQTLTAESKQQNLQSLPSALYTETTSPHLWDV